MSAQEGDGSTAPLLVGPCGGLTARFTNGWTWDVLCTCGFEVVGLTSEEAATDTRAWHRGDSTTPLGRSPHEEAPDGAA